METKRPADEEIINFVSSFEVGITPKVLGYKLNISHSTAKTILYRLSQKGLLKANFRDNRGFYGVDSRIQNIGDGLVWRTEPKVQNFELIYENCNIGEEFCYQEHFPSEDNPIWNIRIRFSKSGNLTILFTGEFGFDFISVIVLSRHYLDEINKKYSCNLEISKLQITRVEEFNDFYKLGLSKNSMFFTDLEGSMLKIYDKGDRLRVEKRLTKRMPLDAIFQNLANPDILKHSSAIIDISDKIDELSKQFSRFMKNQEYYRKDKK